MSKENKYLSKYSNGKTVSAAQYITEIICENKAKIEKKDLHYRFWTSKEWSRYYRDQIATSNKLLQKYDAKAIINALKDVSASKIYSLRAPHLSAIIDKHQKILDEQNKDFTLDINRENDKVFRSEIKRKNILSKLKELDDGN
jgi:hypothetical protein